MECGAAKCSSLQRRSLASVIIRWKPAIRQLAIRAIAPAPLKLERTIKSSRRFVSVHVDIRRGWGPPATVVSHLRPPARSKIKLYLFYCGPGERKAAGVQRTKRPICDHQEPTPTTTAKRTQNDRIPLCTASAQLTQSQRRHTHKLGVPLSL